MAANASQAKTALDHARNTSNSIAVREAAYEESGRLYQGALAHLRKYLDRAITYKNLLHVYAERILLLFTVSGWATPRIYSFWLPLLMESAREYRKYAALVDSECVPAGHERRQWRPVSDVLQRVLDGVMTHVRSSGQEDSGAAGDSNAATRADARLAHAQCVIAACRGAIEPTCTSVTEDSALLLWWGKLQLQVLVLHAQKTTTIGVNNGPCGADLEFAIRTPQLPAVYTEAANIFAADGVEAAMVAVAQLGELSFQDEKEKEMSRILAECAAVREQLEFVRRRGTIVTMLWHALRRLDVAVRGNCDVDIDMDEVLHTMDDIRYALMLAAGNSTSGSREAKQPDVEARCICLHELAELHNVVFHHQEKAYDLHLECVRAAASLTTEDVSEDTAPTGILSSKRWYMRSWKFIQRTRQIKKQTCAQTHSDHFKHIASDVHAITQAFRELPMLNFCQFLYKFYPPRRVWNPQSTTSYRRSLSPLRAAESTAGHCDVFPRDLTKRVLLEIVRDYSSSHQGQYFPHADVPPSWHLLCTEIQKLLNIFYSAEYKSLPAVVKTNGTRHDEGRGRTAQCFHKRKGDGRHRSEPPRQEQTQQQRQQEKEREQREQQQQQEQHGQQQEQEREQEQEQEQEQKREQEQEQEQERERERKQQQPQQQEPEPEHDETAESASFAFHEEPVAAPYCNADRAQKESHDDPAPGTPQRSDLPPQQADSKHKEATPSRTSPMGDGKSPKHKDQDSLSTGSGDANSPDSSDDDADATERMYVSDLQINKARAVMYKNRAAHALERAITAAYTHVGESNGWKTPSIYTEHLPSLCRNICGAIDHNERVLLMVLGAARQHSDDNHDAANVRAQTRAWNESCVHYLCRVLWMWRSAMSVEDCPAVRYRYGRFCMAALRPLRTQAPHLLHQYSALTIEWCTLQVEMLTNALARSDALQRAHPVAEAVHAPGDAWENEGRQIDTALSCHAPLIATVRQHYDNNKCAANTHTAILGMILCRARAVESRLVFARRRAVIVGLVRCAVQRARASPEKGVPSTRVEQESAMDDLRRAYALADSGETGQPEDDAGWPDVEMGCICAHELARVHHMLGTIFAHAAECGHMEKAYALHVETLQRACTMAAEHAKGDPDSGLLATRSWYVASRAYVTQTRAAREQRLARSHALDLAQIHTELTHVKNTFAAVSMLEFLHFLYTTYPPYSHVRNNVNVVLPERVTKTSVLQAIQQYAPTLNDEPRTSSLLCGEILKLLNTWYIERYKNEMTTNCQDASCGTHASPEQGKRYTRSRASGNEARRSKSVFPLEQAARARASQTRNDTRAQGHGRWCFRRAASVGTVVSHSDDECETRPLL